MNSRHGGGNLIISVQSGNWNLTPRGILAGYLQLGDYVIIDSNRGTLNSTGITKKPRIP
jgi:hypothetical protein